MTRRSALRTTSIVVAAVSSDGSGSSASDVAETVFVIVAGVASDGTLAATVSVSVAPAATVPRAHSTSPPTSVHRPSEPGASNTSGAGRRSVSTTPVASDGPVLVSVTVKDAPPPASAAATSATFVTARSARRTIGVIVGAEVASGSPLSNGVDDVAAATFVASLPLIAGETVPVTVISAGGTCPSSDVDDSTVPSAHLTSWPVTVQEPCDVVAAVGTRPGGKVSVTTTSSASELSRSTPFTVSMTPAVTAIR